MNDPRPTQNVAPEIRYKELREQLDQQLANIESALDEHSPSDPAQLHWGHAGDLAHYVELLTQVEDSLLSHRRGREGES